MPKELLHTALFLLTLSLSQFNTAASQRSTGQCGRRNVSSMVREYIEPSFTRIQGGEEAIPHSWPWTAQLLRDGYHICDAVLIDQSYVLTTSHCIAPSPISLRYSILLGGHSYKSGEKYQVVGMSIHPLFNKVWSRAYDYALLKISPPAIINENVSTVCLPTAPPPPNRDCVVTGIF
uniref:Peptidase S1 domain-containing protein n=1 Tax=Plectus sambesii TaxID=2011161 RepID=A0A914XS82_9BILA